VLVIAGGLQARFGLRNAPVPHLDDQLLITGQQAQGYRRGRIERPRGLLTSDDAPQVWLILNEAVIRRVVGAPQTMREQLSRLIDASKLPNVTLQVVPFAGGAHPAMDGSFKLLGFPEPSDPNIVYIEYHTGALYLEKAAEVQRYSLTFDHLRATALSVDASRALIARAAEELP
jgi:hypothetical protein